MTREERRQWLKRLDSLIQKTVNQSSLAGNSPSCPSSKTARILADVSRYERLREYVDEHWESASVFIHEWPETIKGKGIPI